mmetsp:Transcript_19522/g.27596  ORF Transcript_19522/g.27596 Transcript_19522/m.27596 type:complete len:261 (-) Transcript_19522:485-1267(-)
MRDATVKFPGATDYLKIDDDAVQLTSYESQPYDRSIDKVKLCLVHSMTDTGETGNARDDEEGERNDPKHHGKLPGEVHGLGVGAIISKPVVMSRPKVDKRHVSMKEDKVKAYETDMLADTKRPDRFGAKPIHGIIVNNALQKTNTRAWDETESKQGQCSRTHNFVVKIDGEGMPVNGKWKAKKVRANDDNEVESVDCKSNVGRVLPFLANRVLFRGLAFGMREGLNVESEGCLGEVLGVSQSIRVTGRHPRRGPRFALAS